MISLRLQVIGPTFGEARVHQAAIAFGAPPDRSLRSERKLSFMDT